ncbi:hypothetical protein SDJN02_25513, partial [Cucurbita argyrosperma subsp. argyrosperma]
AHRGSSLRAESVSCGMKKILLLQLKRSTEIPMPKSEISVKHRIAACASGRLLVGEQWNQNHLIMSKFSDESDDFFKLLLRRIEGRKLLILTDAKWRSVPSTVATPAITSR